MNTANIDVKGFKEAICKLNDAMENLMPYFGILGVEDPDVEAYIETVCDMAEDITSKLNAIYCSYFGPSIS